MICEGQMTAKTSTFVALAVVRPESRALLHTLAQRARLAAGAACADGMDADEEAEPCAGLDTLLALLLAPMPADLRLVLETKSTGKL